MENLAYVPEEASPKIPIEGFSVTDLNTAFFEEVRKSYTQDRNCRILCQLLAKDCKYNSLIHTLGEIWKISYDGGRFHFLYGTIYHMKKQKCVMTVVDRFLINLVLEKCMTAPSQDPHLRIEQDRKLKPEYGGQCGKRILQNTKKPVADGKKQINLLEQRLGNMIKIQEHSRAWKNGYMYWVTSSLLGGDRRYNAILLIADRLSKTTIFSPCHKDDTAMREALLIWNRVVSWTGMFTKIISVRDPKFTSELCTNFYQLYGTKLSFSTAYHSQNDGLS
ncbi:hypothetical protein O181_043175 [Austropuccinia psidii MF-1]|uniref:Integrase catalytic domain-containing protein n=1 Tax=Austropuccinia psidii MF-1 TaxID=1389203 RepID=A0A9Q3DHY0_9BASI|nr:hypothetical protein [Austropuccinia psidii MF-1]